MDTECKPDTTPALPKIAWGWLLGLAVVQFAIHMAVAGRYDFFRDELYYIQWSHRLAWGYVEQPPMTAGIIWLATHLLGGSLAALRTAPAISGTLVLILAGLLAREMGGRKYAQALAALCVLTGPVFMGTYAVMTMDSANHLFWVGCLFVLARLCRTNDPQNWIWLGVVAGLGLMNKLAMLFFGAAMVLAVLLTPRRRDLLRPYIWFGGVIVAAICSPFLVWLATHDWASLEFMINYGGGNKTVQASFFSWLYMQILTANPFSLPIWLCGLYFLFRTEQGRPFRMLGWLFIILYVLFFALKAKYYFLSPTFPVLFAAGAICIENLLNTPKHHWIPKALPAALLISGAVLSPMCMAVLPVDWLVKYAGLVGGTAGVKTEQLEETELPQHFADQFGWESMVEQTARVFKTLSAEDQQKTAIFASNYGEAAAIDFYGPAYGLPGAISGHNSYFLWGPGKATGEILIAIVPEDDADDFAKHFDSVVIAAHNDCHLCIPHEREKVFLVCRGAKESIEELWPSVKFYY